MPNASSVFHAGRCASVSIAKFYQHIGNSSVGSWLVSDRGRKPKWPAHRPGELPLETQWKYIRFALEGSPNLAANCRWSGHRVALFATKRAGEFRHVGWRGDGTEAPQRMRVRVHHQALEFGPVIGRPDLRERQKETLVRR